jgi:uncharacterized protein
MDAPADPVLLRFRAALDDLYGPCLKRAVLFGSRARGDARPDSGYDVAVFLDPSDELSRLELRILDDTGALIHTIPLPPSAWEERTSFMGELRREGLDL